MRKVIRFPRLNIWALVKLHRDLEEISDKLDHIAYRLDEGHINFKVFESAMLQLRRCRYRLEGALSERRKS